MRQVDIRDDMEGEAETWFAAQGRERWELVTIQFWGSLMGNPAGFRVAMKRPVEPERRKAGLLI